MAIHPVQAALAFLPRILHRQSGSYNVSGSLTGVRNAIAARLFYGDRTERRTLHPEVRGKLDALERQGLAEKVTLQGAAGQLKGYYHHAVAPGIEEPRSGRTAILFVHGSHSCAEHQVLPIAKAYREHGCDVLAVNLSGFGASEGRPSEAVHLKDVDAMFQYLVHERGFNPDHIRIHGLEMGGPLATECALTAQSRSKPVGGVILDRPMVSSDKPRRLWGPLPTFGQSDRIKSAVGMRVGAYSLESSKGRLDAPVVTIRSENLGWKVGALVDRIGNVKHVDAFADFNGRHGERYEQTMKRFTGLALGALDREAGVPSPRTVQRLVRAGADPDLRDGLNRGAPEIAAGARDDISLEGDFRSLSDRSSLPNESDSGYATLARETNTDHLARPAHEADGGYATIKAVRRAASDVPAATQRHVRFDNATAGVSHERAEGWGPETWV